jgi:hypothetical protein
MSDVLPEAGFPHNSVVLCVFKCFSLVIVKFVLSPVSLIFSSLLNGASRFLYLSFYIWYVLFL